MAMLGAAAGRCLVACVRRRAGAGISPEAHYLSRRAGRIGYLGHRGLSLDTLGGKVHVADSAKRGANFCGRNLVCEHLFQFALGRLGLEREQEASIAFASSLMDYRVKPDNDSGEARPSRQRPMRAEHAGGDRDE